MMNHSTSGMPASSQVIIEWYARIVADQLSPAGFITAPVEEASVIRVERGLVLSMALAGVDDGQIARAVGELLGTRKRPADVRVVDAAGHQRPAYRGLLVYAWQRVAAVLGDRLNPELARAWRDVLREWVEALRGEACATVTGRSWAALARHAMGDGRESERVFAELIDRQQPGGAFLAPGASDNPEARWYDELVLLHACTSYAALSGDARAWRAAERAAGYHVNETQPDHATSQPWGLLAFVVSDAARPLADEVLHTVRVRQADGADAVTQILLADTLLGLRQLGAPASGRS